MKAIILSILAIFANVAIAQDKMSEANALCQENKYAEAAEKYEALLAEGKESVSLYYNLGYSYYKQSMIGKAALNFERAKRLAPSDDDINFNLEQIYASTDKMEVLEPVFFVRWSQQIYDFWSSDGWAGIFVMFFVLMLVGIVLFLFADEVVARKAGFFGAIVALLLSIGSLTASINKRNDVLDSKAAIIMSPSVTLCTSPDDKNATQMAVLHEGTYVEIVSRLKDWCEVRLKDGNIGWMKAKDIEMI